MTPLVSDSDQELNQRVAAKYGKRYGCFVSSGTAAIEIALEFLDVASGDQVVVPDNVCPSVVDAIIKVGSQPVFAPTGPSLVPDVDDVINAITPRTKAIICVHLYGLPFAIEELRSRLDHSIALIEDAAQTLGPINRDWSIGQHADVVVTSFGATKPVSLGFGGALFGNDPIIPDLVRRVKERSRHSKVANRPYTFPMPLLSQLPNALALAVNRIVELRDLVGRARPDLERIDMRVWSGTSKDRPSWHRIPIYASGESPRGQEMIFLAKRNGWVQAPHRIRIADLRRFATSSASSAKRDTPKVWLVRSAHFEAFVAWATHIPTTEHADL